MASAYVEGGNASALNDACNRLRDAVTKVRRDACTVIRIVSWTGTTEGIPIELGRAVVVGMLRRTNS